MRLDSVNSFNDTVGVPSREVSGLNRIEPFDPGRSYLFQKVTGTAAVGRRMPLGEPRLPDEDIELLRQWISDGAMPTPNASQSGASKVIGATVSEAGGAQIVRISTSNELDASSILPSSIQLVQSDDAQFDDGNDKAFYEFSVTPASGTAYTLVIRIDNSTTRSGYFKLTLGESPVTNLLDLSGRTVEPFTLQFQARSL